MDCPTLIPATDSREAVIMILTALIIVGYACFFWTSLQTDQAEQTVIGFSNKCRKIWVETYLTHAKHQVTAVQAIRNEIFTLLFIGETSFSAVAVIISVSSALDLTCTMKTLESNDPITGGQELWISPLSKIKLVTSLLTGIFALTLQSLRLLRHASVVAACSGTVAAEEAKSVLDNMHSRASTFNFLATRLIYLLIPALALLLGPTFCLLATLATTAFMHATDHITLPEPRKLLSAMRRRGSQLVQDVADVARRASVEFAQENTSGGTPLARRSVELAAMGVAAKEHRRLPGSLSAQDSAGEGAAPSDAAPV